MDDDSAERWAIRLDAGPLTPEEQALLDEWLAQAERHEGALLRAEAALVYLDRGRALAGATPIAPAMAPARRLVAAIDGHRRTPSLSRRSFLAASGAAGSIAAGFGAFVLLTGGDEIDTEFGEVRRLPLSDGSVATLNTESRIAVTMKPERRDIALLKGEAWFEVAHDKKRPFVVETGDIRVRAVGTAFSVRRRPDGVDILVTEGTVETWIAGHEAQKVRIDSGKRSFIADADKLIVPVESQGEIERMLAWRSGSLALNGEPLSYAVAELNRYNKHKLIVEDAVLGQTPIVGYFSLSEPNTFARSVAELTSARIEGDANETRLSR